jgi:hypothetical protein
MKISLTLLFYCIATSMMAQSPVGKWQKISHISVYEGQKMDSHAALLSQRPCAAQIVYEVNENGTFRLNASESTCDDSYKNIQQRLYSKTKWKVENGKITTSATDFAVGQTYVLRFSGNKMIWVGTEGQGEITYQRK